MSWLKLDDAFPDHPKLGMLSDLAVLGGWLWVSGLCYCGRYLTDGFVPHGQVGKLADFREFGVDVREVASRLVDVGLWERTEGGYQVHDYLKYNPSRADHDASKASLSARGKKGASARHGKRRDSGQSSGPSDGYGPGHSNGESQNRESAEATTLSDSCPVPVSVPFPVSESESDRPVPFDDGFDEFWDAYPKKSGMPKARAAYESSLEAGESAERLIAGAVGYATAVVGRDEQYIKQPSNFIAERVYLQHQPARKRVPCPTCNGDRMMCDGEVTYVCPDCERRQSRDGLKFEDEE